MWGWGFELGGGDQGGCERRIEVFVKIQKKKKIFFFGGGGGRGGGGWVGGGSGWGVRVDVNEELKILGKFTKNRGGGEGGQVGVGLVGGQGGCERNVMG